ncbi:MAG: TonB-dependent receptor [Thermoanaerobaculales bacterium]|nr:TonB-dependent receptor [Thermoanaerobaculales bacterium]
MREAIDGFSSSPHTAAAGVRAIVALCTAFLLTLPIAAASSWCTIEIFAQDGHQNPLDGVDVRVNSELLFKDRLVLTGANGEAIVQALPPGEYRVELTRPGFQWFEVEEVSCLPEAVVRLHVTLEEVEGDEVVFLPSGPVVDVESLEFRRVYPREALDVLPKISPGGDRFPADANEVEVESKKVGLPLSAQAFVGENHSFSSGTGGRRQVVFPRFPDAAGGRQLTIDVGSGSEATIPGTRGSASFLRFSSGARASFGSVSADRRLWSFVALEAGFLDRRDEISFGGGSSSEVIDRGHRSEETNGLISAALRWQAADSGEIDVRLSGGVVETREASSALHVVPESEIPLFDRDVRGLNGVLGWSFVPSDVVAARVEALFDRGSDEIQTRGNGVLAQDQTTDGSFSVGLGNGVWSGAGALPSTNDRLDKLEVGGLIEVLAGAGHRVTAEGRWRRADRSVVFPADFCCSDPDLLTGARLYWRDEFDSYLDLHSAPRRTRGSFTEGSLFLRDHWRVKPDITVVFGLEMRDLRFDAGVDREGYEFGVGDTLSPQLGLVWDFEGNGRSRAWMQWARFRPDIGEAAQLRMAGTLDAETHHYSAGGEESIRPPGAVMVASDLEPAVEDRTVIGVEYELLSDLVVGAAGIHHRLRDGVATLSTDGGLTFEVGRPRGDDWSEDLSWERLEGVFWIHKRLSNGWQADFLVSWSRLRGTWPGPAEVDFADVNREALRDVLVPAALENASGRLPGDRRWKTEAFGSWTFEAGPVLGGRLGYESGAPISRLGALSDGFGLDRRFIDGRGGAGRTSGLWRADVVMSWPFEVDSGVLEARFEAANLLNSHRAVVQDERWSLLDEDQAAGLDREAQYTPGTWGEPLITQAPLEIRLGLGYRW